MNRSLPYLGLLALVLVTFSSCSKKPDAPIPANAGFVLHIDGESISEKLPWSEVKKSTWFQLASENANADSLQTVLMNDPGQSGINIESDGWVFAVTRGKGAYSALSWKLSDAKKLESVIKSANAEITIQKKESTSYLVDEGTLLAWTDDRLLLLNDASEMVRDLNGGAEQKEEYTDTIGDTAPYVEPFSFNSDSLLQIAQELFNLKSGDKIGNDDKFADLIKTDGDVHFWFNIGSLYGKSLAGSLISLSKLSTLLEGNIGTATISFNEGAIEIDSKNYVSKELESLYEKYQSSNLSEAGLKNLPAGEVNFALAMNYPPDGLKAFLSLLGVDGLVNTFLQEAGFSIDEFVKANSGNIFFSLSDFNIKKVKKTFEGFGDEPYSYETTEPDGKLLFGAEVKEPTAFQRLMDVAKKLLTEKAGMPEESLSKVPYQLKDKWFISGNDSMQMQQYGSKQTDHAFIERIKGHPIGMYVNITSFIKGSMTEIGDAPLAKGVADLSLQFWKDIVLTGGEFKGGASVSHITLRLGDEKMNSFKSLNQYFSQIAKLAKEDDERRKAEWGTDDIEPVDTTAVPTPAY